MIVSHLDPRSIRPFAWANRHQGSFASVEFAKIKADIALRAGNIQAIKVRPIPPERARPDDQGADPGVRFEIVFGHRRHRACLELGIPVAAMIETMSDKALFSEMDRENRTGEVCAQLARHTRRRDRLHRAQADARGH